MRSTVHVHDFSSDESTLFYRGPKRMNGREFLMTRAVSSTGSQLFAITNRQQLIAHRQKATP